MNCDYDLLRICRSCRQDDQVLHPIFESTLQGYNGATLHEMFTSCTQLQVKYNDGMPPNVCSTCLADINVAFSFQKRSEQSDMLLKEYLSRKKMEVDNGPERGEEVQLEPLDIKPDIALLDEDLLIEEKCSVAELVTEEPGQSEEMFELLEVEDELSEDATMEEQPLDIKPDIFFIEEVPTMESDQSEGILELQDVEDNKSEDATMSEVFKGYTRMEGGKFACNSCEIIFYNKRGLATHAKQHEPKEVKVCTLCHRTFHTRYHFNQHMKIHEDVNIQCDKCDKQIGSYSEYRKHMTVEHKDLPGFQGQRKESKPDHTFTLMPKKGRKRAELEAICLICDTIFDSIADLRNHLKTHVDPKTFADVNFHTKPYLFEEGCDPDDYQDFIVKRVLRWDVHRFCQIVRLDGEELELSDSDSDPEEDDSPLEGIVRRDHACALCNQSFPRIKTIVEHAKANHRPEELISCQHCSRGFPNKALLMRHLRQQCENYSKKFFCSFCNEKFMWQTSLNKHVQSKHNPTRPLFEKLKPPTAEEKDKTFVCQVCQKAFFKQELLDRHVKSHISEKDTELELAGNLLCKYCGRGFTHSSSLIVHMRRHTGERPYECDICDKAFARLPELQVHRKTHTGEKPCVCTICEKGFLRPKKLARHMKIHTGTSPYSCTHCDRSFVQKTAFKAHQRVTGHFDDGLTSVSISKPNRPETVGQDVKST